MHSVSTVPQPRTAARVAGRGWTVALFMLGALFETVALMNVPGAARPPVSATGSPSVTDLGVLLWLLTTVGWVTVFVRRRHPLLVLIAGGVLALVGTSYLLLLIGVVHAMRRWPRVRVRIGVIAGAIVLLFSAREVFTSWGGALPWVLLRDAGDPELAAGVASVAIALASLAATFGVVAYTRTRGERDANRDRADREHLRAEALGEQLARQAERERLARDIHDALSHRLSAISLQAGAFEASAATSPDLGARARTLREQAHASLEDLRGLLGELRMERRDDAPPSLGSMRALGPLLRDVRAGGTVVDAFVMLDDVAEASTVLDTAVYRIVQESLTNALKHAPGSPVSVYVEASAATGVRIRVSNRLRAGGPETPGSRHGIVGIRERAEALGGTAWIGASEGEFIVDVTLPWSHRG